MTKFLAFLITIACLLTAQPLATTNFVWFDHVKSPLNIPEKKLLQATAQLRRALLQGQPPEQAVTALPDDPAPRVVFITIGDDLWPARTYFGTGFSFHDALQTAIRILQANEKAKETELVKQANAIIKEAEKKAQTAPQDWLDRKRNPGRWTWLKLQVVQAVKPVNTFTFNRTKFAFTDLVGFAFGPSLGFAFTPDQITGRYLLTNQNFISKKQVGNIIAEAFNFEALSTWLRLSNVEQEQRICLFEVDTYFADEIKALRLFRGHRLPQLPTADQCLDAAVRAARAVAERLNPQTGALQQPFPDWSQPQQDQEALKDLAEFSLALQSLTEATGNKAFLDPARYALIPVREALMDFGTPVMTAVVEPEPLPPNSPRQPRTIAALRPNALALLALCRHPLTDPDTLKQARRLAAFLDSMRKPDGSFQNAMIIPGGQPLNYRQADWLVTATDQALAILALQAAAKRWKQPAWKQAAQQSLNALVKTLQAQPDQNLGAISPWIAEALAGAPHVSPAHARLIPRLGAALLAARTTRPPAPDLPGSLTTYPPDTTAAAQNTWALTALAQWLQPIKPDYQEALCAENAVSTAFQLQAQMDLPAASALPRPKFYVDFFRDRLDGFSFSLAAQSAQILSFARTARLLKKHHGGTFPDATMANYILKHNRKFINIHPAYLNTETVSNTRGVSEESRAVMGEISNRKESKVTAEESGLFKSQRKRR